MMRLEQFLSDHLREVLPRTDILFKIPSIERAEDPLKQHEYVYPER